MRKTLREHGYSQGYVTIDASDWYVDSRLRDLIKLDFRMYRLKQFQNPSILCLSLLFQFLDHYM